MGCRKLLLSEILQYRFTSGFLSSWKIISIKLQVLSIRRIIFPDRDIVMGIIDDYSGIKVWCLLKFSFSMK